MVIFFSVIDCMLGKLFIYLYKEKCVVSIETMNTDKSIFLRSGSSEMFSLKTSLMIIEMKL